jgi:uridine phosphorylase
MKPTDLILNPDGSIYHLKLRPEEVPDLVLVAGDPGRVGSISCHFDKVEFRRQNREFVSHLGMLNGTRVLALSTGIGPDNMDIVVNELDALANIDLTKREPKEAHRHLTIVRLGTSGTFYPDIPVGSLAVSTHGLGLDGSLHYYHALNEITDRELTEAFISQVKWPAFLPRPYIIEGSGDVIDRLDGMVFRGITATACGFYGPQGRELRLKTAFPEMLDAIASFSYNGSRILNFEMETSSLYGLGRMLGHNVASICVMLANRTTGEYSSHVESDVEKLIVHVLEQLVP